MTITTVFRSNNPSFYYEQTTYVAPVTSPSSQSVYSQFKGMVRLNSSDNTVMSVRDTDWKSKVQQRIAATNDYIGNGWVKVRLPYARFSSLFVSAGMVYTGTLWGFPSTLGSYAELADAVLDDQAVTRVKRKVASRVGDFAALAPLAELRELRGTVRDVVKLTNDVLLALVDIKKTKGRSAYKYASKAWLTYSFGVKPLLSDIQKLKDAIYAYKLRQDLVSHAKGSAVKSESRSSTLSDFTVAPGINVRVKASIRDELSIRYHYAYKVDLRSGNDYGPAEHFHLEPAALIPTLWELTAFSWVVDYFSTIGAYLEDVFQSDASKCIYALKDNRNRSEISVSVEPYATSPSNTNIVLLDSLNGSGTASHWFFHRYAMSHLPNRVLRFKTWDEIGINGVNRLLNLASLLAGRS